MFYSGRPSGCRPSGHAGGPKKSNDSRVSVPGNAFKGLNQIEGNMLKTNQDLRSLGATNGTVKQNPDTDKALTSMSGGKLDLSVHSVRNAIWELVKFKKTLNFLTYVVPISFLSLSLIS